MTYLRYVSEKIKSGIFCINQHSVYPASQINAKSFHVLEQGCPTPGPRTSTGTQPVRNRAAQRAVSSRRAELHLPLPIARITA